jgi:hypothetical protein
VARLRTLGIWTAAIALVGAIAYGEFVEDWRIQRSDQSARFAMRAGAGASIADYNRLQAAMTEKYGARTETALHIDTGITEVRLDGKLLETHPELKKISDVSGIFVFGPDDDVTMRFPFEVGADFVRATSNQGIHDDLKSRGGTYCVVTWKGKQRGTMLIIVSVADGDPWMRPFTRRLCREITEVALKNFDPLAADSPRYAACILADRPSYVSARKSLAISTYSVGPNNHLARMD